MAILAADFSVTWEPVQPSGAQWAVITHTPSGQGFRLKAALCVRKAWLASPDPEAARRQWLGATGKQYLERLLYEESAEGVREAAIRQVKDAAHAALAAREVCESLKQQYPAQAARIPTITVKIGAD